MPKAHYPGRPLNQMLCNNSIGISQAEKIAIKLFPSIYLAGYYPIFFIRGMEKKVAHIALRLRTHKAHGLTKLYFMPKRLKFPPKYHTAEANAGLKGT